MKVLRRFMSVILLVAMLASAAGCDDEGEMITEPELYTIQYTDGNGIHRIEVKSGDLYALDSIPEKYGYEFLGLFDAESGGTQYVNAQGSALTSFKDNENLVLFPQFKAKSYTLVLDYQGAEVTGVRKMSTSYNSVIGELPTNLSIENKNFTGWYTAPDKGGVQIADEHGILPDKSIISEDIFDLSDKNGFIYLYAGFKYRDCALTLYIGDNTTPEEVSVEWGTHISEVQTETRVDGKAVLTWSKSKNDSTLANAFSGKIENDMVLYSAEFAPVIDFNEMGGDAVNAVVNRAGNAITLPTPKRENYTFMGWYDTKGVKFTSTTMPEISMTLSAKWQANIMLNENGGTEVDDITAPVGEKITLPVTERAGYIFAGWYDESGKKYENTAMPESSVILTARYWKVNREIIQIIDASSYKSNGSTVPKIDYSNDCKNSFTDYLDLTKLYDSGVGKVKIIAHYKSKVPNYTEHKTNMAWYSSDTAGDAYLIVKYEDVHKVKGVYDEYVYAVDLVLNTSKVYFCFYNTRNAVYNIVGLDHHESGYWKDFWVEIEYPDTSVLY